MLLIVAGGLAIAVYLLGYLRASLHRLQQLDQQVQINSRLMQNMAAGVVACDKDGQLNLFNQVAVDWHGADAMRIPPEQWSTYYDLFEADGVTPLATDRIPLMRAFTGESVRNAQIVIAPKGGTKRLVNTNADAIYSQNHKRLGAVAVMQDITAEQASRAQLEYRAFHDALTGLKNRTGLAQAVADHRQAGSSWSALLLADIVGFHGINQALGYDVGDDVLRTVAKRLEAIAPDNATVAHIAADEFGLLLRKLGKDHAQALDTLHTIADKVRDASQEPINLGANKLRLKLPVGAALFGPDTPPQADLLAQAGLALDTAKAGEASPLVVYQDAMHEALLKRRELASELEKALDERALKVAYQPQCSPDGKLLGVEALSRWTHAGAELPPDEFIAIAEYSGEIIRLGQHVLRSACELLAQWSRSPETAALTVAVNVSAVELESETFADQVLATVAEFGAPPSRLHLEITESVLLANTALSKRIVHQLRSAGVGVVLDDFGTGYSSLAYLSELPVDALKIDRSFTARTGDNGRGDILVRAITSLAKQLGIQIVAEGIETPQQLQHLCDLGCTIFQGYLFDRAVPQNALRATYSAG